jgi:hypothetical protein
VRVDEIGDPDLAVKRLAIEGLAGLRDQPKIRNVSEHGQRRTADASGD